jgi:hypothetical protein
LAPNHPFRSFSAFIGGLDITDGRYDSCLFPLFSTIKTLHQVTSQV